MQKYLSTDTRIQGCLKSSINNNNTIEKEASFLGTSKLLLANGEPDVVEGIGDLHVAVVGIRNLLPLGSNVDYSGQSGKTKRGK